MATIVKAPSKARKAVIRRQGWPAVSKSFRNRAQVRRLPAMRVMADPVHVEDLPNPNDDGPDMLTHVRELVVGVEQVGLR
jgi:hypothetical protein